jgi:hypothetical protein
MCNQVYFNLLERTHEIYATVDATPGSEYGTLNGFIIHRKIEFQLAKFQVTAIQADYYDIMFDGW